MAKAVSTYGFIHILRQIRQVQICVVGIRKCFETLVVADLKRCQLVQ